MIISRKTNESNFFHFQSVPTHVWVTLIKERLSKEDCISKVYKNVYAIVHFLSQVIFVFLLFWGMVMYANEVETNLKKNRNYLR